MKAILIDPTARTVTEIELDFGNGGSTRELDVVYKAMGCDLVDIVRLPHGNMLIVDDEGLLKPNHVYRIQGYHEMLAGKTLLIGDNNNNFQQPPTVTLAEANEMVLWTNYVTNS